MILDTDDNIAVKTNIEVYKSLDGFFYRTEEAARYASCTHRACESCGKPAKKIYTLCHECLAIASKNRWLIMPSKKWDESVPVYSLEYETFFYNSDEIKDYIEEELIKTIEELRLVVCEPCHFRQITDDFWSDDLGEDQELPEAIYGAMNEINAIISAVEPPCFQPGKFRAEL